MDEYTLTEHNRINNYLRKRSAQTLLNKEIINYEDKLSNFPIGLIIITKDPLINNEDKLEFLNHYACKLFEIKDSTSIFELKSKFKEYIKLKSNSTSKTTLTLKDVIFHSPSFNLEIENFFPFQSKQSKSTILYIKIQDIGNKKYIVIDKYDKYMEEQKFIEFNLIKNINYQYLHTLYHELNNPLNALLAISAENKQQLDFTNISKPSIDKEGTFKSYYKRKPYKRDKNQSGLISIEHLKNKIISYHSQEINKNRKKGLFENNDSHKISSRINLLVKIIKIFIKNFILYLKTRTDNLLMLKNEFNTQNEASDIKNCVEVSDYEKDLQNRKKVKLNLEYILDLYFKKYHCLFKYKEIKFETNFSELKNIFVITDDFNFSYFIRQIYTYLYYVVPKKEGFCFEYKNMDNNKIQILIKKKSYGNISKRTDEPNDFTMNQLIQTKEMTKEVLYSMSKKLDFHLEIYDNEDNEENNYLSIILPIVKKDKTTEDDEFKDEDINEMIGSNYDLIKEKLKRKLPDSHLLGERNYSFISSINIGDDAISKNYEDKKGTIESFISLPKNLTHKKNENNINSIFNNNYIENTLNNNWVHNAHNSMNSIPSNDTTLNKCIKGSDKNSEKEKPKFKKDRNVNIKLIKNKINNHSSNKNIIINITNINNSPKKHRYIKTKSNVELNKIINDNNENIIKSQKTQKLKGIFTIINNFGYSEDMGLYENVKLSSNESQKKNKNKFTFKESSQNHSLKDKPININNYNSKNSSNYNNNYNSNSNTKYNSKYNSIYNSNYKFELNRRTSDAQGSIKTGFFGIKNNMKSNYKSSCFISEIVEENDEKNKNNNKNEILNDLTKLEKVGVTIEYQKDTKFKESPMISKKYKHKNSKNTILSEIEEFGKKRNSQILIDNLNHSKVSKDAMTFFDKKKLNNLRESITVIDDNILQNQNLFLDAKKERQLHLQETRNKNKNTKDNVYCISKSSESIKHDISKENEESLNHSEEICNCADLLIVDDEEFNVMASQKMFLKLGHLSDKAYNGQECIDLIVQKGKSYCKCGKNYYKIIFLDIVMPIMDGIKTAHKIQEMIDNKEINENVNIIFISGNIDGPDLKKTLLEIN